MIRMTIDAMIGGAWSTVLTCPTCGSTDRDVFLPIILPARATMLCDNGWHEDRIIKKATKKSGKAAARQSQVFWRMVDLGLEKVI